MFINSKRQNFFKKKLIIYVFLLVVLGCIIVFLNSFFLRKPLFISPLGRMNSDVAMVEKSLREKNIAFSQVLALSDFTYIIYISNNGQVKLSQTKNIGKQIASLQRILIALTIEGKLFKSIDFRFKEPIVSF